VIRIPALFCIPALFAFVHCFQQGYYLSPVSRIKQKEKYMKNEIEVRQEDIAG